MVQVIVAVYGAFIIFDSIFLFSNLNDLTAPWVQEVLPSDFQTQQHCQGPLFLGGEKREYLSWSSFALFDE